MSQALAAECEAARLHLLGYFHVGCSAIFDALFSQVVVAVWGGFLGRFLGEFWEGNFFHAPFAFTSVYDQQVVEGIEMLFEQGCAQCEIRPERERICQNIYFCISLWTSYRLHTAFLGTQDMD